MIFKIKHITGVIEYAQAKNFLHLIESYNDEFDSIDDVSNIQVITEDEAKSIELLNTEYDEDSTDDIPEKLSLFDLVCGDDFVIVGSTEW